MYFQGIFENENLKKYLPCAGFLSYGSAVLWVLTLTQRRESLGNPEPLLALNLVRDRSLLFLNKITLKSLALTIRLVISVVLMGWCVQEHQSKDVQIPHPIDACEKGTVHLDCDITPLPMAFGHLWREDSDTELEPRRNTTPTREQPTQKPSLFYTWEKCRATYDSSF